MSAGCNIFGEDGTTVLLTSESLAKEAIAGETYAEKVSLMSKAHGKLSRDIAGGFKTVFKKRK